MQIWVLRDNKIGSNRQAEVLAKALGSNVTNKNIVYNMFMCLPNVIRPWKLGINFKKSDNLLSDNEIPDIIISAGRRLAGVAIFLKKYFKTGLNRKIKLISILNPNCNFRNFDLVILPLHDKARHSNNNGNVIYINGSLCDTEISVTDQVKNYWHKKLEGAKTPFFSLLVGGDVKGHRMDPVKFALMVRKVSNYVSDMEGTLLLSTSRRTNNLCMEKAKKWLKCDHYLYKWTENDDIPNPYYLFVEKSSIIFITGDSISMISETVTAGKSTYVYMPSELGGTKQESFCKNLFEKDMAREIDQSENIIEEFKGDEPLNELKNVLKFIENNVPELC
ncbi:MAG: mitochondrial fission ELM1 family protein [Rickettsiales bacterium]|nr:mitochondrial fission ELM1 family protein [Rickettsiales bacterium]